MCSASSSPGLDEAFAGLISEHTLSHRLALVFGPRIVDPRGVVGDLNSRTQRRRRPSRLAAFADSLRRSATDHDRETLVLALDWTAGDADLLVGRGAECELQLKDETISRSHAKLAFRGGGWVIQDLGSTNGTWVNGRRVGRSQLRPGDRLALGTRPLRID